MQKITTCLWFDDKAEEAATFYVSLFENSRIKNVSRYGENSGQNSGKKPGDVLTASYELDGQEFLNIAGGPVYSPNPSVSLSVACSSTEEIDRLFEKLSEGGQVMMPLDKYPFSERYAWVSDRFGVSWQLNITEHQPKIATALMFVGEQNGRAEEALEFYTSKFADSKIESIARYTEEEPGETGTIKHARFYLSNQLFMALDSNAPHQFAFTPGVSLMVNCVDQAEVDRFWSELSEGGQLIHCGWLTDKFGVSWQVVPVALGEMMRGDDQKRKDQMMGAMLKMQKLDIATLEEAYAR